MDRFSARSLSFSCFSSAFSCLSIWFFQVQPAPCKCETSVKHCTNGATRRAYHKREVGFNLAYLHLRAAVLEPELDLPRLQAQALAQLGALLLVRVWALLEQPAAQKNIDALARRHVTQAR
jgi:hypothetical protein